MEDRKLGNTDLDISPLGMGTIQITRLPWKESLDVVRGVYDLGVNWFDTAQGYLDSEMRLGDALRDIRDRVVIMTKSGAGDSEKLKEHVDASLQRLRTDYIDVLFFHGGSAVHTEDFSAPGGILETALRYVENGKVRHLGFSAHRPETALRCLDFPQLEVAMVPANYISREYIDGEFMERALANGIGLIAMKPFGGGRLRHTGACLRFLKTYPDLVPCIGVDSAAQMAENIESWESDRAHDREDERILEEQRRLLGDKFCRLCSYCLPCPEEIPIPTVNFLKVFSLQMPRDKVVTESHDEAVEKAGQCTECRRCVERCPYDLDIPALLKENAAFYREFASNG